MDLYTKNNRLEFQLAGLRPSGTFRWVGVAAVSVAIFAATMGVQRRQHQAVHLEQWTETAAIPTVSIVMPERGVSGVQLTLPGDIQAWYEAPIYARVSGYLKNWYFDYGARVKAGQLLAEIDAPELDAQFANAQAKLNAANSVVTVRQAELELARTTYERWRDSPKGIVSLQETMEKKGDFETATARLKAAAADVEAAKGEVERLEAFEGFKRITAPFDGIVTERNTDIGALISAGSGAGGGARAALFRVVEVHKMRIFVKVPQQLSAGLQEGLTADLHLPQYPAKTFKAIVATTSRAIDTASRTLLVELNAENSDDLLQPGTYAEVRFNLPGNPEMMHLPTSALLFRKSGLEVAVVRDDNKVELKKVTIGRNLGTQVEILAGITASDRIVNSPPDSLEAGDLVRLAAEPAAGGEQRNLEAESDRINAE